MKWEIEHHFKLNDWKATVTRLWLPSATSTAGDLLLTLNTLRLRQNGHFTDVIFKCIFLNENVWILLKISLKSVPKVQINNIPTLVQMMAWYWPDDKPLSEPMMVSLLMHICITQPQWVKHLGHFFFKMCNICNFFMFFMECNTLFETIPIHWIFYQHCGYWGPDALAPDH